MCLALSRSSGSGSSVGGSPPVACASACESSQSASQGFRGSSGPCRYVPIARPTRQPSWPDSPSFPKPATTRPSGSAPGSSRVRPAWFSKPASVRLARPELAVEQHVADQPPFARDASRARRGRRRGGRAARGRGSRGRAADSRRRRRGAPRRRRPPPRSRPPFAARSARSAPARGPGRRRCRADRARPARSVVSRPRRRRRRARGRGARRAASSTAMLPRSA